MRRALLLREWREIRVLTIVAAILAVLMSVGIDAWFLQGRDGALMAAWIVPAILGLYLALIASDLVAADVATRRIDAMALLPARMLDVWRAKVVSALVAGAVFLVGLVAVELAILAITGVPGQVGSFVAALPDALPNLAFAFLLFAAVLFFSTLLQRGFAAVFAGVLVLAAVICLWCACNWVGWNVDASPPRAGEAALWIALVFLAGSALAFVRGPAHGPSLRRALVGIAVPLGVFVPVCIGSAIALDRMLTLEAGSPDARIVAIFPSPDAQYVALRVEKNGCPNSSYLWIVRTVDGHLVAWRDPHLYVEGWGDAGSTSFVLAWNYTGGNPWRNSMLGTPTVLRWIDPTKAGFMPMLKKDQIDPNARAAPPTAQARTLLHTDGRWIVRDAITKADVELEDMPKADFEPWIMHSPHARYAKLYSKSGAWIVDLVERRVVYSESLGKGEGFGAEWVRGCDDDRYALIGTSLKGWGLFDLVDGVRMTVAGNAYINGDDIAAGPNGGFFVLRDTGQVDLTDANCRTIRHVYPPDR